MIPDEAVEEAMKNNREELAMNAGPEVSAEAVQELKETPGLIVGPGGRLLIQWEDDE